MAAIITWAENTNPPIQLTINDEAMSSLEQYRLTQRDYSPVTNREETLYADVFSMILTIMSNVLIQPALQQFPTVEIKTAAEAAALAIAALEQAKTDFINGSLTATK